jgi:hypothetical protein
MSPHQLTVTVKWPGDLLTPENESMKLSSVTTNRGYQQAQSISKRLQVLSLKLERFKEENQSKKIRDPMEKHQSEAALLNQVNQRHLMETLLILQTTIALKEKVKPDGDF